MMMIKYLFWSVLFSVTVKQLNAQQVISVKTDDGHVKEILVLPFDPYQLSTDSSWAEKGAVKTEHIAVTTGSNFKTELENAAVKTALHGGNIFQVTGITDGKQMNDFRMKGTAYYADSYEAEKNKALAKKAKKCKHTDEAWLIIYRPAYTRGANDEEFFTLVINDTLMMDMKANSRYIFKIARDVNVRVAIAGSIISQTISVKRGDNYYFRALVNIPGSHKIVNVGTLALPVKGFAPFIEAIDEVQGEMESSLVNQIVVNKKI